MLRMKKLETADVARILNITPATVRQLEQKGALAAERTVSGTRLFDQSDVERLARERAAQRKARGGK
jgi:DNA-binding transcriptional MerR regulator